jgi:hypothetical protein
VDQSQSQFLAPGQAPPFYSQGGVFADQATFYAEQFQDVQQTQASDELSKLFEDEATSSGLWSAAIIAVFIMVLGLAVAYQFAFLKEVRELAAKKVAEGRAGDDWVFQLSCAKIVRCSGAIGRCEKRPEERACLSLRNEGTVPIPPSIYSNMGIDYVHVKQEIGEEETIPFSDVWLLEGDSCHRFPECADCPNLSPKKSMTVMVPTDFEKFYRIDGAQVRPRADMTRVTQFCKVVPAELP